KLVDGWHSLLILLKTRTALTITPVRETRALYAGILAFVKPGHPLTAAFSVLFRKGGGGNFTQRRVVERWLRPQPKGRRSAAERRQNVAHGASRGMAAASIKPRERRKNDWRDARSSAAPRLDWERRRLPRADATGLNSFAA